MSEQVLVFPDESFRNFKDEVWFSTSQDDINFWYGHIYSDFSKCYYIDREEAEHNAFYKQIIPYCVLRKGDKFLVYQRTKKGNESRLHSKWSMGIGGHVNPNDRGLAEAALLRELQEELIFPEGYQFPVSDFFPVAMLYDGTNDVGKVHFGLIYQLKLDFLPEGREASVSNVKFVNKEELLALKQETETWTQILISNLDQL